MNVSTRATTSQAYSTHIFVSVATPLVAMVKLMTSIAIRGALATKPDHVVHFGTILCTLSVCTMEVLD